MPRRKPRPPKPQFPYLQEPALVAGSFYLWETRVDIVICTYGRSQRQVTWSSLPESLRSRTLLVVQAREAHLYDTYPTLVLPPHIQNIGGTREFLKSKLEDKVLMLDDDLVFATRREDDPTKFRPAIDDEVSAMFSHIELALDRFAHVGVAPREGANRNTEPYMYDQRMMRVLGYRMDVLREEEIIFDRLPVMEDFDATLQLLRKGYHNVILNSWCHNQGGSNTDGGCSSFRTDGVQEAAARGLAELHRGFVTVVKKQTKTSWGGKERYDVRIQWKKARESAGTAKLLDR